MSLILEALKKSEQQRRIGEAPTLGSPVVATRRRRNLLPVLAILIVIVTAAAWWLTRPPRSPAPTVASTSDADTIRAAKPAPPGPAARTPASPLQNLGAQDRKTPSMTAAQVAAQKNAQVAALKNAARATPRPAAAGAMPKTPVTARAPEAPSTRAAATPQASPPQRAAAAMPAAPSAPVAPRPAQQAAATPAASSSDKSRAAPAQATTKPSAAAPAMPSVWELPYATRKDLPAIDLSMHVYSADPKQRFVVIKGDRHVEGDEIGQDLILREIRQDGLVLEYKGQAFFFPRNGR